MILPGLLPLAVLAILQEAASPAADASSMEYIQVESDALGDRIDVGVYLPPGLDPGDRYPVLYFLHGMNGSEHKWEERHVPALVDRLVQSGRMKPFLVVCPDGRNSMWINWKNGEGPWEDFVAEELVDAIDDRYPTYPRRDQRGLSGDSMGGYGAFVIGLHRPEVFGAISAHSAAIYPEDPEQLPEWVRRNMQRFAPLFGDPIDMDWWRDNNPLYLAGSLEPTRLERTRIYFDVGNQDRFGFNKTDQDLHQILEQRDVPHEFHLRDGGHGREYFEANVQHSLEFHDKVFRDGAKGEQPASSS